METIGSYNNWNSTISRLVEAPSRPNMIDLLELGAGLRDGIPCLILVCYVIFLYSPALMTTCI